MKEIEPVSPGASFVSEASHVPRGADADNVPAPAFSLIRMIGGEPMLPLVMGDHPRSQPRDGHSCPCIDRGKKGNSHESNRSDTCVSLRGYRKRGAFCLI